MAQSHSSCGQASNASSRSYRWFSDKDVHVIDSDQRPLLFVVNGSRLYQVDSGIARLIRFGLESGDPDIVTGILASIGIVHVPSFDVPPLERAPVRSLSLAIAETCNLGCVYCYAEQGSFGRKAQLMRPDIALKAVECLFDGVLPGDRVQLAFLGGEPLLNRQGIRKATEHAAALALEKGASIGYAITTNGTLIDATDGDFFEDHGFSVTVSLDGIDEVHDKLRPRRRGGGTFDGIVARLRPLLERQKDMQVSARVTVTPYNLGIKQTLEQLLEFGSHSVGFSPSLSAPTGQNEMGTAELDQMLREMIACGEEFERRTLAGYSYPFSNLINALWEIHRGSHRPYPCGGGASYLGVSSEGNLFVCHRFVEDADAHMGNVFDGISQSIQTRWLTDRHVDNQLPCQGCWARYLCGGGCHYEVIKRGRPSCDYIRGWLDYCLRVYVNISRQHPEFFQSSL